MISLLDLYFPKVRLSRKKAKDKDWITIGIKNAIKHRNQLYRKKIKDNTEENVKNWEDYKNKLNKIIKNAQKDYYQNLIKQHNNNCIGLWKTLGNIISKKTIPKPNKAATGVTGTCSLNVCLGSLGLGLSGSEDLGSGSDSFKECL